VPHLLFCSLKKSCPASTTGKTGFFKKVGPGERGKFRVVLEDENWFKCCWGEGGIDLSAGEGRGELSERTIKKEKQGGGGSRISKSALRIGLGFWGGHAS